MAVPTRTEALSLLLSVSPSARLVRHVTVVAEVAAFMAHRANRAGLAVDRRLVETAAILHDIDKALPRDDPLRELGHGRAGAAWLVEAGHPELARAVESHPVMRLGRSDAATWIEEGPLEDRIVMYADKRATQRVVSLQQRFDRWRRRHPEYADRLEVAQDRAERLEATLCSSFGVGPGRVERLRWVDEAMARAAANGDLVVPEPRPRPGGPAASETGTIAPDPPLA